MNTIPADRGAEDDEKDEEVQEDNASDSEDITDNQKGNKEINVD